MKPCWYAICLLLAFLVLRTGFAATPCVQAAVSVDAAHHYVLLHMNFPANVNGLQLDNYPGYQRAKLWSSPDGSARVADNTITLTDPAHRTATLRMDVHKNIARPDRTYRPFLRFSDGSIAVYSGNFALAGPSAAKLCLGYAAAPGESVIGYGKVSHGTIQAPARSGYVVFGDPRIVDADGLALVIDRSAPAWIVQRVVSEVPAANRYFTKELWPVRQPLVILWAAPQLEGFNGDHLDASITLGVFGPEWNQPDPGASRVLLHFIRHELFHSWNAGESFPLAGDTGLLASEGGADAGAAIAEAVVAKQPADATWRDSASHAYNACLAELPEHESLAARLQEPSPNKLPYDCGQAVLFALAAAAPTHDPVATYFAMWRHLHAHPPERAYAWRDLVPADADRVAVQALARAIDQPDAFANEYAAAITAAGFRLTPEPDPSIDERTSAARALIYWAMADDCGGRISFWTKPDGFLIDPAAAPECKTLHAGKRVVGMLGENLRSDPWKLTGQVRALCAKRQPIEIDYADHTPSTEISCHDAPKVVARPRRIVRATNDAP